MRYFFILYIMTIVKFNFAQNYPAFKFKTVPTQWDYFTIDTNFVKNDHRNPHVTKYSSMFTSELLNHSGKLFILQNTYSSNQFVEENGYLLHQLDSKTGKINWINYNNTFNKNYKLHKHSQTLLPGRSFVNDNNQVVVLSHISKDTILKDDTGPLFYRYYYVESVFDVNSGKEISTTIGNNNINPNLYIDCINCQYTLYVRGMNDYCQLSYKFYVKDTNTFERAEFYNLTDEMNIDTTLVQTFVYDTSIKSTFPFGDYPDIYSQLNKDTVLMLNYVTYPKDLAYNPDKASLRWIDISDRKDTKEVYEFDIKPYYILPDRNFIKETPKILTIDNNIIVAQRIFDDKTNPTKARYWLLWLDAKGIEQSSVRNLVADNKIYEYICPYTVKDDKLYLLGSFSDGEELGVDIIKIEKNTNNVSVLSNLIRYPHLKKTQFIHPTNAIWVDKEHSVFGFQMLKDTIQFTSNYFYYMCVQNNELGITSKIQETSSDKDIEIYPNPTSDGITVSFGTEFTGILSVRDIHGRTLKKSNRLKEEKFYHFSLDSFPGGIYYIYYEHSDGYTQVVKQPIIKI